MMNDLVCIFGKRISALLLLAFMAMTPAWARTASTVMLISIDGLKPEAVLQAEQHGLKLPNLVQLTTDGTYSSGVRGVLPTLTYPSHTTLLTGCLRRCMASMPTLPSIRSTAITRAGTVLRRHQGGDALGCGARGRPHHRECLLAGERWRLHR